MPRQNSRDVCLDVRRLLPRGEAQDGEELEVHLQHVRQRTPSLVESPGIFNGSGIVVNTVEMVGGKSRRVLTCLVCAHGPGELAVEGRRHTRIAVQHHPRKVSPPDKYPARRKYISYQWPRTNPLLSKQTSLALNLRNAHIQEDYTRVSLTGLWS